MNNILCDYISRSCLCTENNGDWAGRFLACFDFKIFVNDIECIHLLSLILVKSLNLDIVDGVVI